MSGGRVNLIPAFEAPPRLRKHIEISRKKFILVLVQLFVFGKMYISKWIENLQQFFWIEYEVLSSWFYPCYGCRKFQTNATFTVQILSIKVTIAWISINSFCWMESHQMSADAENMKKLGAWKSAAIEGMAASRGAVVSGFQRQLLHPHHHHHTTRQTRWPSPHLVSCALPEPGFHWEEGIPYHTCKWFEDIFGTGNCIYWKVKPDM